METFIALKVSAKDDKVQLIDLENNNFDKVKALIDDK